MKQYKLVWRAGQHIWGDEALFRSLLTLLTEPPALVDEWNLFISEPSNHAYHPISELKERCSAFIRARDAARAYGLRIGIDPWPTFGDAAVRCENDREMPFDPMIARDGNSLVRVACPISPDFLAYTKEKFRLFASTAPDFVWIDDDCRFTHLGGAEYPCFCPRCVQGFEGGRFPDRESLVTALNQPKNLPLRRKWSEYSAKRLARYCKAAREALDEVDPRIDLPYMTVGYTHTTFSGNYIEACMDAARSRAARPGHGFYWDDEPRNIFKKTMDVARQVLRYPIDAHDDIQYEEESHPITPLNKATEVRILEAALSVWAGCTGIAFNSLTTSGGPEPFGHMAYGLARWRTVRPFLDTYLNESHDLPQIGLWVAEDEFLMAGMDCSNGWFRENTPEYSIERVMGEWPEMGIALSADREHAYATVLQGKVAEAFDDEELARIFRKPVFLDSVALSVLEKRGLHHYAGVRCGDSLAGCVEELTDSACNGDFVGARRHALFEPGVALIPEAEDVEILSHAIDPYGTVKGACATRRGNVTVFSYSPYQFIGTVGNLYRMRQLMKDAGAPILLEPQSPYGISRLSVWARGNESRSVVLLMNTSLDPTPPTDLILKGSLSRARAIAPDGSQMPLSLVREEAHARIPIPTLGTWEMLLIIAEA